MWKKFWKSQLTHHWRTHRMPYEYEKCGKTFWKSALSIDRRTHTGEKHYANSVGNILLEGRAHFTSEDSNKSETLLMARI